MFTRNDYTILHKSDEDLRETSANMLTSKLYVVYSR